jgi:hypothetical protein
MKRIKYHGCEMVRALAAILVFSCVSSTGAREPATLELALLKSVRSQAQAEKAYITVKGRYSNYDYAYSVLLPKGVVGLRSPSPNPNHGFLVRLDGGGNDQIVVDASYNAAEWKSLDEALSAALSQFTREQNAEARVMMRTSAVLGGLDAIHFRLLSGMPGSSNAIVEDVVLAFRKESGGVGIVYKIALTAAALRYERHQPLLMRLQRSFRLKPLPK